MKENGFLSYELGIIKVWHSVFELLEYVELRKCYAVMLSSLPRTCRL